MNDNRPGRSELIENLIYARDFCGGLFCVVLVTEEAGKLQWTPSPLVMRLVSFDPETGEFSARVVHPEFRRSLHSSNGSDARALSGKKDQAATILVRLARHV